MSTIGTLDWDACYQCRHRNADGVCKPIRDSGSVIITLDILSDVVICDEFEEVEEDE